MAFTPAHAVAVLPGVATLRRRAPAAVPVLVAGSMAPDFPYYVPVPVSRDLTHSLPGLVGIDAVMAVVAGLLWTYALARPLRSLAPEAVRARLGTRPGRAMRPRDAFVMYAAAVVAGFTHLVWDAFTHWGGWFVQHLPALTGLVGGVRVFQWLQVLTSLAGLAVLVLLGVRRLRRAEPRPTDPGVGWSGPAWTLVVASVGAGAAWGATVAPVSLWSQPSVYAASVLTFSLRCGGLLVGLVCLAWWVRRPDRAVARSASGRRPSSLAQ